MSNKAVIPYEIIFKQGALQARTMVYTSDNAAEFFADPVPDDGMLKLKCQGETVFVCRKADILSVTNANTNVIHELQWQKKLDLDKGKELKIVR